jgi:hypothetical protein
MATKSAYGRKPVADKSARNTRAFMRYQNAAKGLGETLSPRELIVVTAFLRNLARLAHVGNGLMNDYTGVVSGAISYFADGRMDREYFSAPTVQAKPWRKNSFAVRYPELDELVQKHKAGAKRRKS